MGLEDDFCDIIKKSRFGQGLGLGSVADSSHISTIELEHLEKGHRLPTKAEIQALGQALHLRTTSLVNLTLEGWVPNPQPDWTIEQDLVETILGEISGYGVKGYLLTDPSTRHTLMIDTGYNAKRMLIQIKERDLKLVGVALTHGHTDHAGGLEDILEEWNVPVYLGNGDFDLLPWKPLDSSLKVPTDRHPIGVGKLTVECLATPGHTPGGLCFLTSHKGQPLCFVGDTLFAGSIGRSNPFSLYESHLHSVRHTVLKLPANTVLFPGHGPCTTVAEEKHHNPFG